MPAAQTGRATGSNRPPGSGTPGSRGTVTRLAALAIVLAAVALGIVGLSGLAGGGSTASPTGSVTIASPTGAGATPSASTPAETDATPPPSPAVSPSPEPSPTAGGGLVAPTSAEGFALRKTVIDISFPIAPSVKYRYKDDFLIPRVGVTHRYNHARGVSASGRLLRAHDGIDIRVDLRTRLLATFSGTVIDPATRWKPWDPERYGNVVVIVSDEPSSVGYAALYAHLSSSRVEVGDHVERGQVIGRVGTTGNAAGLRPHVHFELRAPFRIPVREGGRIRRIDAFGPYPSLVAADPKRRD